MAQESEAVVHGIPHPDIFWLWFSLVVCVLGTPAVIEWWLDTIFDNTWLSYKLLPYGFYYYQGAWVWPQNETRLNSSLSYGPAPYKEFRIGPFGWRRYL